MDKNRNSNNNDQRRAGSPPDAPARTRIALVLDRSGSMDTIREPARGAFNEAISRVQADARAGAQSEIETTLSVMTFNQAVHDVLVNASVEEVRPLRRRDYLPSGATALLDAIAHAMDGLEQAGPLGERDAALVIVISDGYENASRKISQANLVERMQTLEATEQWTFSFLMANVDITDLAARMRTEASNYAQWQPNAKGMRQAGHDLSLGVRNYLGARRRGAKYVKDFYAQRERFRNAAPGDE